MLKVKYGNRLYERVKQTEKGICEGCEFSEDDGSSAAACIKLGENCNPVKDGSMLIFKEVKK